jgi:hypothetical protein
MPDPRLVYVVSWQFSDGGSFFYAVRMKESQAKLVDSLLLRYVDSGYLVSGGVEEIGGPINSQNLMKIIKEEFPDSEKEWMP